MLQRFCCLRLILDWKFFRQILFKHTVKEEEKHNTCVHVMTNQKWSSRSLYFAYFCQSGPAERFDIACILQASQHDPLSRTPRSERCVAAAHV